MAARIAKRTKKRLPHVILLAGLMSIVNMPVCYANPIIPGSPDLTVPLHSILVLWILSPIIEALFIVFILKWIFAYSITFIRPFLLVVLLNLMTIPITQIFGTYLISSQDNHNIVYLAELFPLVSEFLVLKLIFNHLHRHGNISENVSARRTLLLTLGANALTFGLGLWFFYYFPAAANLRGRFH